MRRFRRSGCKYLEAHTLPLLLGYLVLWLGSVLLKSRRPKRGVGYKLLGRVQTLRETFSPLPVENGLGCWWVRTFPIAYSIVSVVVPFLGCLVGSSIRRTDYTKTRNYNGEYGYWAFRSSGLFLPRGSYPTPFLGCLLYKIADPNHKTRYPKKG